LIGSFIPRASRLHDDLRDEVLSGRTATGFSAMKLILDKIKKK